MNPVRALLAAPAVQPVARIFDWKAAKTFAGLALSAGLLLAAAVLLWRELHGIGVAEVRAEVQAWGWMRIAGAVALTVTSYGLLSLNEWAALRWVGLKPGFLACAARTLVAYGLAQSLGFNLLVGGAVRARLHRRFGADLGQTAAVTAYGAASFAFGLFALGGLALLLRGPTFEIAGGLVATRLAGAGLLALALGYPLAAAVLNRRGRAASRWSVPDPARALGQVAVGVLDNAVVAAILWLLLPAGAASYPAVAAAFSAAALLGLASGLPGGVGVFESALFAFLPGIAPVPFAAAALGYRLIYYIAPLAISAGALPLLDPAAEGLKRLVGRARGLAPPVSAALAFGLGAVLILTGVAPITSDRLPTLKAAVPLWALETGHLVSLVCGLVLMGAAAGLIRRRASARNFALGAALIGSAAALARGIDIGPATWGAILALLLTAARPVFYRRGERSHDPIERATGLGVVAVFIGSVILGLWIYAEAPLEAGLLTHMGYRADPARFLRGTATMAAFLLMFGAWRLTHTVRPSTPLAGADELDAILPLVEASPSTQARLALTGDKAVLTAPDGTAFLMWAAEGRSLVAMGDPVGARDAAREMLWRFRERADRIDARPVFYQVGPERLGDYLDLGLGLVKLGEEAHVRLADFSLAGSARRNLRQMHARALREGLTFALLPPGQPAAVMDQLAEVSRAWLASRGAGEKGFSLGRFDPAVLRRDPVAVAMHQGRIVAFANVWTGGAVEASVDLMRHYPEAPHGVMDFLLVELVLWCKGQGFERFNLGMAPLSGLAEHPLAPLWHKLGRLAARRGARFYGFEGLRAFKAKFDPEWRPSYLAAPPRQIPAALMDVARLIARPRPDADWSAEEEEQVA